MVTPETKTIVASAVRIRRPDDAVLLVRPAAGLAGGIWSLPMAQMPEQSTAEATAAQVVRDGLRMQPGWFQFAETLSIRRDSIEVVINVFDAVGWSGEPRYAERDYEDAAWVFVEALDGVDVIPEVAAWLRGDDAPVPDDVQPERLAGMLVQARGEVISAYSSIAPRDRERPLDGDWAPVDVLAHLASAEAYYLREARQLGSSGAHPWRPFNAEQWDADRLYRARPMDAEVVARLHQVQADTLKTIGGMVEAELAHYGSRGFGGAVRVGEALLAIADHDLEHAAQLTKMQSNARSGGGA
ncbi:MAG: DinB family protein [Dehalococcoidia bacterium]